MKVLKSLLSAALILCLLLCALPSACALEDDERFAGKTWDQVIEEFNERMDIGPKNVSFGYRNAVTGEEHFYNGDNYMVSASMYKVPLNMAVSEKLANGEIDWDTTIGGLTYQKLQLGSIVYSDNDYAKKLWLYLGNGNYRTYRRLIAPLMGEDADTVDAKYYENNFFTARQVIHCLNLLYTESDRFPGVIDMMLKAEPDRYFRRDEKRYDIAHKYGFLQTDYTLYLNDCGIVYTEEPCLIVCFTDNQYNAYDVLAKYCSLMADYTEYQTAHRQAAEGALDKALADLALPRFTAVAAAPVAPPEETAPPEPEPAAPEAESGAEAKEPLPIPPFRYVLLVLAAALLFFLTAAAVRALRRRRKHLLAAILSLPLAAAVLFVAAIDRSPPYAGDAPSPVAAILSPRPLFSRPDPQEAVMAFFDALELQDYEKFYSMLDGYSDLSLDQRPEDAPGRMVLGALRDSYSYRLEGEAELSGDRARQLVHFRSLDLNALEQALQAAARARLEQIAEERPYREICDDDGFYRQSVVEEACQDATTSLLGHVQDFYREQELTLSLVYSDGWLVCGNPALVSAVTGR